MHARKLFEYSGFMLLIMGVSALSYAQPDYLEDFPSACSEASDREPLPGHILRLGYTANTPLGWSFLFPDRNVGDRLQRVSIADNVGLIGQDPGADFSDIIRARTPPGSFVVAQIFIGEEESFEPIVTCISRARLLQSYSPSYYGQDFVWLDRTVFKRWLGFKRYYDKWNWKKWYRKDFRGIRDRYRHYHKHRDRKHDGRHRDRDDRKGRDRRDHDNRDRRDLNKEPGWKHRQNQNRRDRVQTQVQERERPTREVGRNDRGPAKRPVNVQRPIKKDEQSNQNEVRTMSRMKDRARPMVQRQDNDDGDETPKRRQPERGRR